MADQKTIQNRLFILITVAFFLVSLLPALLKQGMFVDGVTYAAISRNLAIGEGSFWDLHYFTIPGHTFYGHPPLAFGLESLLFRLFGDHFLVERLYSFLTALLSFFGIVLIWKELASKELRGTYWLPVMLWLTAQIVSWSYTNNMLENSLTVFTLFSSWSLLRYIKREKIIWLIPAAFFLVASLGVKGPTGLFPLGIPFFYWLSFRKGKFLKMAGDSLLLLFLTAAVIILIFILNKEALSFSEKYFNTQILSSVRGEKELAPDRLYILRQLFMQLIPMLFLTLLGVIFNQRDERSTRPDKTTLFCLLIALSAALPLMISPKQRTFYLVPAMPWFALTLACYLCPLMNTYIIKIREKTAKSLYLPVLLLIIAITAFSVSQTGKIRRDKELINDVYALTAVLPENSDISVAGDLPEKWQLVAYLERFGRISLEKNKADQYLIREKSDEKEFNYAGDTYLILSSPELNNYSLYQKNNAL